MELFMKNKLIDLNDHLFAQLERLSDEELVGDELTKELQRTKAVTSIAEQIISNADLGLRAQIAISEYTIKKPPLMLGIDGYEEKD